jgi:tetratricopeptide (TPR) repeat protein
VIGVAALIACLLLGADLPGRSAGQTAPAGQTASAAVADTTTPIAIALKDARALLDKDQAAAAIEKLTALGDTGDPRVQALLGVACYHAGQAPRAAALLQQAHDRLPADSAEQHEAEEVLGLTLQLQGRYADAIPFLEKTRARTPENLELSFVLGQAYIQTRQPAPARDALARTFGLAPDSAAAHVVTAQLMMRLQMEPLAETELAAALARDAKTPHANYLLGQIALFRGRFDDAVQFSTRELALNPTDAMAFYQMGDAYTRQAKWEEAVRALQRSLWLNPFFSGPYILLGKSYLKLGRPATAESMLRRGIAYDPNNGTAHYLLAQVLQQLGRAEDAQREFTRAAQLQEQPGRPE